VLRFRLLLFVSLLTIVSIGLGRYFYSVGMTGSSKLSPESDRIQQEAPQPQGTADEKADSAFASRPLPTRLIVQRGHADRVNAIALSLGGRMMATASGDHTVILRDVVANRTVGQLTGHRGAVVCVQFSPDAKTLLTGGRITPFVYGT